MNTENMDPQDCKVDCILFALDDSKLEELYAYAKKKFYEFDRAKNGLEAIELVEKGHYDVVLMDIKMPVMDGMEATKKIKALHPNLPIIAVTANAFDSDRQLAFDAGCDDFLAKPISSELCLNTIKNLIGE